MTTLHELRDVARNRLISGDAVGALKVFRLVLEGAPLDFTTRLLIADTLMALDEKRLAGAVYTAVAVYGIKAGLPLQAIVAIKALAPHFDDAARRLGNDLAALYDKDSPRVGRGIRPSPADLSAQVRDDIDLNYEMGNEELCETTAQMAAFLDNITNFPNKTPPVPLFSGLTADALERVIQALELRRLNHGEMIVRQGDPGDCFFVVAQGMVKVYRDIEEGGRRELAHLGAGSILGEMSVISAEQRTASVEADGQAELLVFTCEAVAALADELPQVGALLERFASQRMVLNLLSTNPFFQPFDDEQRRSLLGRFETHQVSDKTIMVRQGEEGRGLYLMLHGAVEVVRTEQDGAHNRLAVLGPGDCFGEISLIQDRPTTAQVAATKDSTIMFLPREYFQKIVDAVPTLGEYYLDLGVERLMEAKRAAAEKPSIATSDHSIRI